MSTKIAWTSETWNPVVGCTQVSEGCRNCYAARFASRGLRPEHRGLTINGRWVGHVTLIPERLEQPLRWRNPRRIFVCSMGDLFHKSVPDEFIDRAFAVMALCPQHTFQVLTKRDARMASYSAARLRYPGRMWDSYIKAGGFAPKLGTLPSWPLPNVWLGVTAENQETADERIPLLLQTPAAVRFVSCEPLLETIDFSRFEGRRRSTDSLFAMPGHETITLPFDWVIVGGESGPGARPCHTEWIRSIVTQCREAGVAVFVKQLGAHVLTDHEPEDSGAPQAGGRILPESRSGADPTEWPEDLRVREYPV